VTIPITFLLLVFFVFFLTSIGLQGLKSATDAFHHVEKAARDEVIANGGSISHHHGGISFSLAVHFMGLAHPRMFDFLSI